MAKVGGPEQADMPRCVEHGGGTIVGNPGDNLWRDSITRLFRIPKGTEWPSDVLFEGEFQSINLGARSLFFHSQQAV